MSVQDAFNKIARDHHLFDEVSVTKKKDSDSSDAKSQYAITDMKLKAATAIQTWAESDDLADDETAAERLQSLFIGIVDANKNGELDDDEVEYFNMLLEVGWDYLASKGIEEGDISALLNDWDEAAADRIMDYLTNSLPDGDDAMADLDSFAFSEEDQEPIYDAVYKNVVKIVGGLKKRVKKRISGHVRLSGLQKAAVRKMQMKSHSASAMMHRAKSMLMRKRVGLKNMK